MKAAYSIILMLCFSLVCKAQEDRGNIADSMAMVSRTKADKVLQLFDTIAAPKLLYSLDNKYFYVIIKSNLCYQEYYVALDSLGRIDKMRSCKSRNKNQKAEEATGAIPAVTIRGRTHI